jgi:hypothetical protein
MTAAVATAENVLIWETASAWISELPLRDSSRWKRSEGRGPGQPGLSPPPLFPSVGHRKVLALFPTFFVASLARRRFRPVSPNHTCRPPSLPSSNLLSTIAASSPNPLQTSSKPYLVQVSGLAGPGTVSFEALASPGHFLSSFGGLPDPKQGLPLTLQARQPDPAFAAASSFHVGPGLASYHPMSFVAKVNWPHICRTFFLLKRACIDCCGPFVVNTHQAAGRRTGLTREFE